MLCFWTTHDWSLMSLTGIYEFGKKPIGELEFQELDGDDFTFNMAASISERGAKIKQFRLKLDKIDRHVLMNRFTINIMYCYLDDYDMQVFGNTYVITVSVTSKLQFQVITKFFPCQTATLLPIDYQTAI